MLVVSKENFETHIEHLEQVLTKLAEERSKSMLAIVCCYCDKLEYLGYVMNCKRAKQL